MDLPSNEFLSLARALKKPANYWAGTPSLPLALPEGVIVFREAPIASAPLSHARFVLLINVATPGTIILDHREWLFAPGHMLLIFPYQVHVYRVPPGSSDWVFVTFEMAQTSFWHPLRGRILPLDHRLWTMAEELVRCYMGGQATDEVENGRTVLSLMRLLLEMLIRAPRSGPGIVARGRRGSVVGRVGEFLERNLARRVGIEDIAGDLGLSPSQLRLLFKRATSVSLGRYIELTRLTHAFFLLKNSDQNVSQVAYACGYKSIHSFSRMFKRHNGISPRAFRKRERAREE